MNKKEKIPSKFAGDPMPVTKPKEAHEFSLASLILNFDAICMLCALPVPKGTTALVQSGGVRHTVCPGTNESKIKVIRRPSTRTKLSGKQYCKHCKSYTHTKECKGWRGKVW